MFEKNSFITFMIKKYRTLLFEAFVFGQSLTNKQDMAEIKLILTESSVQRLPVIGQIPFN